MANFGSVDRRGFNEDFGDEICKFYARGHCMHGDRCRRSHMNQGAVMDKFAVQSRPPYRPGPPRHQSAPTGPWLGKGSELEKVWWLADRLGHQAGVSCACMMRSQFITGGEDRRALIWNLELGVGSAYLSCDMEVQLPHSVSTALFHTESRWLFFGLRNGTIRAFSQDTSEQADLQGHSGAIMCILVHQAVLLSGSEDGTVRAWRYEMSAVEHGWQCATCISSALGGVTSLLVPSPDCLWIGASKGITCLQLQSMQPAGSILTAAHVVWMCALQGSVLVAFSDGSVTAYDPAGNVLATHPSVGEHKTNTAVTLGFHEQSNAPILYCGQEFGYVTVYNLPDFKARGTFKTGYDGDVSTIVELGSGLFVTCGMDGDVVLWRWS